jgi:hypothetical protein
MDSTKDVIISTILMIVINLPRESTETLELPITNYLTKNLVIEYLVSKIMFIVKVNLLKPDDFGSFVGFIVAITIINVFEEVFMDSFQLPEALPITTSNLTIIVIKFQEEEIIEFAFTIKDLYPIKLLITTLMD